ncbi:MAG TPA: EAL domain-containing response regulator [Stellaceae bacterium]|nr:EAL domain-containing response regulator [Stellaceae bacterium]
MSPESRDRLLIVDDDEAFPRIVKKVATGLGFEVVATSSAEDFKAAARTWNPTLVMLDLVMPGSDGVELLRHLAAVKCAAPIAVTSGLDGRTVETVIRLGTERGLRMIGTLTKPVPVARLRSFLGEFASARTQVAAGELAEAIANDELFLHYQPKLDCRTGRVGAVEALVRWRSPARGTVFPDQFIELAEATGLIDRLTEWVVSRAARQAVSWREQGLALDVAINISAINTRDLALPDRLAELCRAAGIGPENITLELTETGAMRDPVQMMDVLTRLRLKGFHLSLDDFGTGYSSLVQLQRMPFDELKIDRSFVMQMTRSKEARSIVEIVIDLARKLGLSSLAEGVETQPILDELVALGCDGVQGYHLSRPADAERVPELVGKFPGSYMTAA